MVSERPERYLFVTGKLAESALRRMVGELSQAIGFDYHIEVMPISVAALMTAEWIVKRMGSVPKCDRAIVPGYCRGDLDVLAGHLGIPVELGPRDLRRLPEHFGQKPSRDESYGGWDIEIIAEINHAPQWSLERLVAEAKRLVGEGADWIDLGCDPEGDWGGIAEAVEALRELGIRVSIDSLNPTEIRQGVQAGAELVLSLNSSNRFLADELQATFVVIPDDPKTLAGLDETVEWVARSGNPLRIDPILEPIGMGFASSLDRYLRVRDRYPDAEMMMGVGNLTELTDVDSAGVNATLLGFCQEVGIRSVLTTQVIPWARTAVRECVAARELMHYACRNQVPPKRLDERLVMLRDPKVVSPTHEELEELSRNLRDQNYRVFVVGEELHLVAGGLHLVASDPFDLFDSLMDRNPRNVDASHAFYLGFELSKALTAVTLGKDYRQDEALGWGLLTRSEEQRHRLRKRLKRDQGIGESLGGDADASVDEQNLSGLGDTSSDSAAERRE